MEYPTNSLAIWNTVIAGASEEMLAEMGLLPGDDAAYWFETIGSDAYTHEMAVVSGYSCNEGDAEEAATALVAASATLLAVALLN